MRRLLLAGCALALAAGRAGAVSGPDAVRADFLRLIDRPKVPLDAQLSRPGADGTLTRFDFSYATEAGQRVPGILLEPGIIGGPAGRRPRPVVIVLHGTGGRKEAVLPFLRQAAAAGFVAIAIDGRYHGERAGGAKGSAAYVAAILRTYRTGGEHPFFFDSVWDVMRLIDWLQTRPEIDPRRIGLTGFSKGGIETYLAAAVDPRVAVAVPCIALESFRYSADHDQWHSRISTVQAAFDAAARDEGVAHPDGAFVHRFYAKVAPGLDGEFDGPSMAPLISPRPLLAVNGDADPRASGPGLTEAVDAVRAAYARDGASGRFALFLEPHTGHKVTDEGYARDLAWLVRWLQP
ncbi:MAG TPA: dienelactone hydrolase family protein [Opitutaceae bacterium]|nr:dienelactone hydrolase family protein [Opitutaceae bacterium]